MQDQHGIAALDAETRSARAIRVTWVGFFWNVVLTLFKFAAAVFGHSAAMMADAVHSLSDFVTDLVVVLGFSVVRRPADATHDYGHGKVETLITLLIGIMLVGVALGIFVSGARKVAAFIGGEALAQPGMVALVAALVSIVVKEGLYRYTRRVGLAIDSQAVIANAWHHRSDMFSSLGTALGIGGAILLGDNWRLLDPLAACVVSVFIVKVALGIALRSLNDLLEGSLSERVEDEIITHITHIDGVQGPHNLRTRRVGSDIAIDVHIRVDQGLSIVEAHDIATRVEERLKNAYGMGTFVSIHVEPDF